MRQDEWKRTGPEAGDWRRSAVARVAPLHDEDADGAVAVAIVLVSATLAIVLSTLATTLF